MRVTIFRLVTVIILSILFASCKTQHVTSNDTMLYNQALENLNRKHFKIIVNEFLDKRNNRTPEFPLESYITVNGNEAVIRFSKDLSNSSSFGSSFIEDKKSQILNKRMNKKGDTLFDIEIDGGSSWLKYTLQVTLYKNSNKCFVQVKNRWSEEVATLKGIVEVDKDER